MHLFGECDCPPFVNNKLKSWEFYVGQLFCRVIVLAGIRLESELMMRYRYNGKKILSQGRLYFKK